MSEIRKWLETIGLGQYGDAFESNDLDMDLIRQIDDQALRELGMTNTGHRLGIRNAITKLTAAPVGEVNLSPTAAKHETTAPSAERRQLTVMFCDLVGSTALSARLDAVRAFTRLRNGICTNRAKGTREYATLLSIQQTLRYGGMSFLEFMRSGRMEIDG